MTIQNTCLACGPGAAGDGELPPHATNSAASAATHNLIPKTRGYRLGFSGTFKAHQSALPSRSGESGKMNLTPSTSPLASCRVSALTRYVPGGASTWTSDAVAVPASNPREWVSRSPSKATLQPAGGGPGSPAQTVNA